MGLEVLINNDMKSSMLSKDFAKLEALRAIKAALLLEKTGKDVSSGEIPEKVEVQLLQKLVKQRRESARIFEEQGRKDLADVEIFQAEIIEKYLPQQLSEDEVRTQVAQIVKDVNASSMKDMGKVMAMANDKFAGAADGKLIADIVKEILGK